MVEKTDPGAWRWAGQALDALVDLQRLASAARATSQTAVEPATSAEPLRRLRHAVQIGITQTERRAWAASTAGSAVSGCLSEFEPAAECPQRKVGAVQLIPEHGRPEEDAGDGLLCPAAVV